MKCTSSTSILLRFLACLIILILPTVVTPCNLGSFNITSATDNGDGTYTYTIQACFGVDVNWGEITEFTLDADVSISNSGFSPTVSTTYNYCDVSLSFNGQNCTSGNVMGQGPAGGNIVAGVSSAPGSVSGGNLTYSTPNNGDPLAPDDIVASCPDCNNPTSVCVDVTFMTTTPLTTISMTTAEAGTPCTYVDNTPPPLSPPIACGSPPTAGFTSNSPNCIGSGFDFTNTGSMNMGSPDYTYSYTFTGGSPATSTSEDPSGVTWASAGNFSVSQTICDINDATCCATFSTTINVGAPPTLSITPTPETCAGDNDGAADLTITGGTTPYQIDWSNGPTTEDISGLAPASYTVTVTDGYGCVATASVTIDPGSGPTCGFTISGDLCLATNSVDFNNTGTSGGGSSYSWDFGDAGTSTQQNPSHTYGSAGTFTVTQTITQGGCSCTSTQNVTIEPMPDATINPLGPFCADQGNQALSAATGGGTWSGTGVSGSNFNPTTAGAGTHTVTYSVTVSGCTSTDTEQIVVNPIPDPTIDPAGPFCQSDGSTTLTAATAGGTFSGPGMAGNDFFPTATGAGTFTITYSITVNGCTDTDTEQIIVNPLPNATITPIGPFCETDGSTGLSAATGGGTWSGTGVSGSNFNPSTAGAGTHTVTYSVTVNGCTSTDTEQIVVNPLPDATINPIGPFCDDLGNQALTAATAGGTWSGTGVSGTNFNPSNAGAGTFTITYSVTVGGCTDSDTEQIVVNPVPDATITPIGPFCDDIGNQALTAATAGGTFSGTGVSGTNFNPTTAGPGTYTISYTVTVNGCTDTDTEQIVVNPVPDATINPIGPFCDNVGNQALSAATGGGTFSGTGVSGSNFNPTTAGPGTHTVSYTVTVNGCTDTDTEQIVVNPVPDATINPIGPFCDNVGNQALSAATGGGTFSGTGVSGSNFNPTTAGPGTYTISYTVTVNGCTDTDTEQIVVNPVPDATINPIGPFCDGAGSAALTAATAGGTWSGTGVSGTNFNPTTAGPGTYVISYNITVNGCSDSDTEQIVVNPIPDPTITPPAAFCPGDAATNLSSATGGGTWSGTGITNAATGTFDPSVAGSGTHIITYSVTVNGCTATDTEDIVINIQLDATITLTGPYCATAAPVNLIGADPGGTWSGTGITNAANGTFDPATAGPGTHTITYGIAGTCGDTDTENIVVNPIPDPTITPAGPFCATDASVTLNAATAGGTWTGPGVSGTTFDPATAGTGTHNITYSVTVNGCTATDVESIIVNPIPDATITAIGPFCADLGNQALTAVTAGGTFSGTGVTGNNFNPTTAGAGTHTVSYTVTVNGCTDTDTEQIVVNPIPDPTISAIGPFCESDAVTGLTAVTGGGAFSGTGVSGTNFDPTGAGPGTHTISYTVTVNGCTATDTEQIVVNPIPDATITPIGPFCDDLGNQALTSATAGGTWSGTGVSGTNFNPSTAGSGTHVISYTITVNGCTDTDTEQIVVNPVPDATITPVGPFCETDGSVGLVSATTGGTWSGTGVSGTNFDPASAGPGTHTVTYSITLIGCTDSDTENIVVNPIPDPTITPAGPFCDGDAAIALSAATAGGTFSGTGVSGGNFDPTAAGAGTFTISYTVTVNGCTDTDTEDFVVNPIPDPTISPAGPFCIDAAAVVLSAATAGGTFSGSGVSGTSFNPLTAGAGTHTISYTVTVNGCTDTDTENIVVNPLPNPSITALGPFCINAAVEPLVAATSGGTWSGPGVSGTNFDPAAAGSGTHVISYTVTVNGCTASDTEQIIVNPLPDPTITPPAAFCPGDPAGNLIAATAGGTWSGTGITDAVNGTFDPGVAGTGTHNITYTLTDGNGCSNTDTENIVINGTLDATITLTGPFCDNGNATTFTAADPGGTWAGTGITNTSTGAFNPTTAGAGTHTISYTIPGGCGDSDTENFVVNPTPDATISPVGPFCNGDPAVPLVSGTAGGTWSGSGVSAGNFDPATSGNGTHTVSYTVTVNGCTDTDTEDVIVNPIPNANITPAGPFCETAAAITLNAATAGGTWTGNGVTGTSFDPAVAGSGTHTITYSVTVNGCTSTDTENIVVNPIPDPTITPLTLCATDPSSPLTAVTPGGTWTGNGVAGTNFDPATAGPGTHVISYTITVNGCSDSDTENMIVNPIPDPTITAIGPFCETDAISGLVSATAGGTWTGNGVSGTNFDPAVAGSGTHNISYSVTVNGCTDSDTEDIVVNPIPDPTITAAGPFCASDAGSNLSAATAGGTWSGNGITDAVNGTFDPATAGSGTHNITYSVTVNGCTDTDTEDIVVNPVPDPTITQPPAFCPTDAPFNLTAASAGGTWSGTGITDAVNGTFDPAVSGAGTFVVTYSVTLNGCTDSDTESIVVNSAFDATIVPPLAMCENDAPVIIVGADAGGTWAGNGITPATGSFNPTTAGPGTHNITYTIAGTCGDSDTEDVVVNPSMDATITAAGPFCLIDPAVNLVAVDAAGTWTGTGITDGVNGTFDPAIAGPGTHSITYDISGLCGDTDQINVVVIDNPDPTISPAGPFCDGDASLNLSAVDGGGTWTGTGITDGINGTFDPTTAGPGTHNIVYTIGGSCGSSDSEDVIVNPIPDPTITPVGPFCDGDALTPLTSATLGGTWSGTGVVGTDFDPAVAGPGTHNVTYSVTVNGCTDTDTEDIVVSPLPDATITPAGPFCDNVASLNLTAVTAGGTWSGTGITDAVNGTFDPVTAGVGTHNVTYTVTIGSCSDSDTEDIVVNPMPDPTITPVGPLCETDPLSPLTSVTPGGTWTGTGVSGTDFDPSVAGTGTFVISYSITLTGCTDTDTESIVVNPVPDATINPIGPFCDGAAAATLTAATSGGTWTGTGVTGNSFNPSTAGPGTHTISYSITVAGCSDSDTENVIVNPQPDATITPPAAFCPGDPASNLVSATAGGTWSGTGITDPANGTFDPSVAGVGTFSITYSITLNGCSDSDTEQLVINSQLDATITPIGPFCETDAAVTLIGADPGGTWSGNGVSGTQFDPSVAGIGTHNVSYVIGGTCGDSDTEDVIVTAVPDATITPDGPFCTDDPIATLVGATPGGTWTGTGVSGTDFDPALAGAGTHSITYSISQNGCTDTDLENFVVNPLPDPNINAAGPLCENGTSITLGSATVGGTFSGPGVSGTSFDPVVAGVGTHNVTYSVTVNGCTDTDTEDIIVNPLPDPSIIASGPYCEDGVIDTLLSVVSGGVWSGSGITDSIFNPATAGSGTHNITYSITVNGCSDSDTEDLIVNPLPDPTINPLALCTSDPVTPLVSATAGGTWSGTGVSGTDFDPSVSGAGTFVITYNVTVNGCSDSDTENMVVSGSFDATITANGPFCESDASVSLVGFDNGGTWSGTGITDPVVGTFDPATALAGTHNITYVIGGSCGDSDTEDFVVNPIPDPTISPAGPFCDGDPIFTLTPATPGGTFTGSGITGSDFDPAATGAGTFIITYSVTVNGCSATDTENIVVNPIPDASISAAGPFCQTDANDTLISVVSGGVWSGLGITDSIFSPGTAGSGTHNITYTLTVNGCTASETEDIVVNPIPNPTITAAGPVCVDGGLINLSAATAGGTWSGPGVTGTDFDPSVAGVGTHNISYSVTTNGCSDSDTENIVVNPLPDPTITPPAAFCPGDAPGNLIAATPGGTWSGTGITDPVNGTFDPSIAGTGTHNVTYTVTDGNGCTDSDTENIVINGTLDATITLTGPYCDNDPATTFLAADPGGTWTGSGITNGSTGAFDPATAGPGTHNITYLIPGSCGDSDTENFVVNLTPDATITPDGPFCSGVAAVPLVASSAGGTWSGSGVSAGMFDPTVAGNGTHTVSYTVSNAGCTDTDTEDFIVNPVPNATISPAGPFCIDESSTEIFVVTSGGTWSGGGMTDSIFDPATSGVGTFTISYNITLNGCSSSDTENIVVNDLPDPTITALALCISDPATPLTSATAGGTWSGLGVSAGNFNPTVSGIGTHNVTYSLTVNGCSNSDTEDVVVNPLPDPTITAGGPFCITDPLVTLNSATAGGVWTGNGIGGTDFDPATAGSGTHIISYTVTVNGCSDSDTESFVVNPLPDPTISATGPFCVDALPSNLSAAASGGTWTGNGITDPSLGTFDPAIAGSGTHNVSYNVTVNGCTDSDTEDIVVNPLPNPTISLPPAFCPTDAPFNLTSSTVGGTWSGTGITDPVNGTFDPAIAGPGTFNISYSVTVNGCTDSDTENLVVNNAFDATINAQGALCESDSPVTLSATDAGGTWAGNGVSPLTGVFDPFVAGAGTHNITYTISGTCGDSDTENVVVNPAPNATITLAGPYCVSDPATNMTAVDPNGTWSGTGITDMLLGTFDPSTAGIGTHNIVYVIPGSCIDRDTIQVIVMFSPDPTISAAGPFCESDPSTNLIAVDAGGTWSGLGISDATIGTFDPSIAGVGTHNITYSISGSCGSSDSEAIVVLPDMNASITASGPYCESDSPVNLTAVDGGGSWSGNGITDSVLGVFDPLIAGSGTHVITYSISGQCGDTQTTSIVVNLNSDATITPAGPYCTIDPAVNLNAANSGGTWTGVGITDPALGTFNPGLAGIGTHVITYSITGTCGDTQTQTIIVNDQFDATISNPGTQCLDGTPIQITAVDGGGVWSGPGMSSTGIFDPAVAGAGTHEITYQIIASCGDSDIDTITVDQIIITSIDTIGTTCVTNCDGQLTVNASGGVNYSIDGGLSWQASSVFTGLCTGTYLLYAQNALGCIDTMSATIDNPSALQMSFAAFDASCFNSCDGMGIVIPTGGSGNYTYGWSPNPGTGQGTPNAQNLCAGNYLFTLDDGTGCFIDTAFTINQPTEINFTTSSLTSYCGQLTGETSIDNLNGGVTPYSYAWGAGANNQTTATATGLIDGLYTVTISDGNACDSVVNVSVTNTPGPSMTLDSTMVLCFDSCNGTASSFPVGGSGPGTYSYMWDVNTGSQTTQTAVGLCVGIFNVTVTDTNNCSVVDNVTITQPQPVGITVVPDTIICLQSSATISALASGGIGNYQLVWDNNLVGNGPHTVSPANDTCYNVYAVDANGCESATSNVCVNYLPPITVSVMDPAPICEGDNVVLSASATGGNGGPFNMTWQDINGQNVGSGTSLTVTPPDTNPDTTVYTVVVDDQCSPSGNAVVNVTYFPQPVISIYPESSFGCEPLLVNFVNSTLNSVSCVWDFGNGVSVDDCNPMVPYVYDEAGTYDVSLTITSNDGCIEIGTGLSQILVNPIPTADFDFTPTDATVMNTNIWFTDYSSFDVSIWNWTFFDVDGDVLDTSNLPSPQYEFPWEEAGEYPVTLEVTTAAGCSSSTDTIIPIAPEFAIAAPNCFTPNGDGINDTWFPRGVGYDRLNFKFYILDRWGDLIFESHSDNDPWDGTARELGGTSIVQQDVYIWRLEVIDLSNNRKEREYVGHVTVLRD